MSQYYKKYMKKREEERPGYLKLFVGAFLLMIVFFVIVATHLTLSVDTSIGENDEGDIKESGLGVKHLIDSRLRFIQMEDISGTKSVKQENTSDNINNYGKEIEINDKETYSGKYSNSYGYEPTEKVQPYSPTYNNAKKQYDAQVSGVNKTTSQTQSYANKVNSVPVATPRAKSPAPVPSVPLHNMQKNLTPAGM